MTDREPPSLDKVLSASKRRQLWRAVKELENGARRVSLVLDDRNGDLIIRPEGEIRPAD